MARSLLLIAALAVVSTGVIFSGRLHAQATNAAPKPPEPAPLLPADDITRYGKILKPNDHLPYSFKLSMPIPGFGEVKVPTKEELDMRQKLEQLAALSDDQIRTQLAKWPGFSKMSLADEGSMLMRIQQFRDYRTKMAMEKQDRLGLVTLNPVQQARFEKEYWSEQIQMDRQLAQQLEPIVKAREQQMNEKLFREFSAPPKLAQSPKPGDKPADSMMMR